jgi:hypothetical protein
LIPISEIRATGEFVSSILEASRGEKLKYERASMIEASKGAHTLAQVHQNIRDILKRKRVRDERAYICLNAYLEKVVPQIDQIRWAKSVALHPGVNVMDLTALEGEMQHLVIKSTIDWILNKEDGTVIVVPEAWKFIPQARGTPVKLAAEAFIRQGAGLGNYLWIDSQDIGGIEKTFLRGMPLWIIGVQREANEIKRTLENIPAGTAKPTPEAIAKLKLGHFFACWDEHVHHVYAQPTWMSDEDAIRIARGQADARDFAAPIVDRAAAPTPVVIQDPPRAREQISMAAPPAPPQPIIESEDEMSAQEVKEIKEHFSASIKDLGEQIVKGLRGAIAPPAARAPSTATVNNHAPSATLPADTESLYQEFKKRLLEEIPAELTLHLERPEIKLKIERPTIEADKSSMLGRVAYLIHTGFYDSPKQSGAALKELERTGPRVNNKSLSSAHSDLVRMGFLTDEPGGYQAVRDMKGNIKK